MRIPIALMAIAASLSVTLPAQQVDGFYLSPRHTALVWSQSDTNLQMWRVQLGAKPQWTELAEPQQVLAFMHRQKKEDPESSGVAVDVASGILRLFWLQHTDCEAKQAESRPYPDDTLPCAYTLHQAATPVANLIAGKDSGAVWRVTSSKMIDTPSEEMVDFDEIKMVDRQHGWMILSDNSLMNRMPQNLATTADGGAHWTTQKAKGMPIGTDFSQLLIARSATEAWFAKTAIRALHGSFHRVTVYRVLHWACSRSQSQVLSRTKARAGIAWQRMERRGCQPQRCRIRATVLRVIFRRRYSPTSGWDFRQ